MRDALHNKYCLKVGTKIEAQNFIDILKSQKLMLPTSQLVHSAFILIQRDCTNRVRCLTLWCCHVFLVTSSIYLPFSMLLCWPVRPDAMPEAMSLNWARLQLICQSFTPLFNALTKFKAVTCVPFICSSVLGACIYPGEHSLWTWLSSHSARASLICQEQNACRYTSWRANM